MRDRNPRRNGDIYCSPACGCNCTWNEYQQAHRNALALAEYLGPGWETNVWENGGWNYEVKNGLIELHPNYARLTAKNGAELKHFVGFSLFIQTNPQLAVLNGKDPDELLNQAHELMQEHVSALQGQLDLMQQQLIKGIVKSATTEKVAEKYATSIIKNPSDYDALEIAGVRDISEPDRDGTECVTDNENPEFYSVYARLRDGQEEFNCIGDFSELSDAEAYAEEVVTTYGVDWPINNRARKERT